MGAERHAEDPHGGGWPAPKLILAGRIDGTVDGRPVHLIAEHRSLVITVESWRTLLRISRSLRSLLPALPPVPGSSGIRLFVELKWLGRLEVHPDPAFPVRLLRAW